GVGGGWDPPLIWRGHALPRHGELFADLLLERFGEGRLWEGGWRGRRSRGALGRRSGDAPPSRMSMSASSGGGHTLTTRPPPKRFPTAPPLPAPSPDFRGTHAALLLTSQALLFGPDVAS